MPSLTVRAPATPALIATARVARHHPAIIAIALAGLLYLATLSRNYSGDSLIYAMAVDSGQWAALIDPYHLLLHPLGWLSYRLWQLAGWTGGSLLPLQVLNALAGALCVGLLWRIAFHLTKSARLASLVAAGFAVSGGMWLLSTEAEFVTVPLAAMLLVLFFLLTTTVERAGRPVIVLCLGLMTGLAVLTYFSAVFLVPGVILGFVGQTKKTIAAQRGRILLFLVAVLLATIPGYLLLLGPRFQGSQTRLWAMTGGSIYGQLAWQDLPHGLYAFLRSLALFPDLGMNDRTSVFLAGADTWQRAFFLGYYGLVLVVAFVPIRMAFMRRRELWRDHRSPLLALFTWAFLCGAFALYWVPGDISFWLPLLVVWWLLVAMVASTRRAQPPSALDRPPEARHEPGQAPVPAHIQNVATFKRGNVTMFLTGGVVLLGTLNALFLILPHHDLSRNQAYGVAISLARATAANDLIIVSSPGSGDSLSLYLPYFGGRKVFPFYHNLPEGQRNSYSAALAGEIAATRAKGGRVFLVGDWPGPGWQLPGEWGAPAGGVGAVEAPAFSEIGGRPVWQLLP